MSIVDFSNLSSPATDKGLMGEGPKDSTNRGSATPSQRSPSSTKRHSQSTSTSLSEQEEEPKENINPSPTISSFDSQQSLDRQETDSKNSLNCCSVQISTEVMDNLVRRKTDTLLSRQHHKQQYMQNQQHHTLETHHQHTEAPMGVSNHKETPNTSHSDSPQTATHEGEKQEPAISPDFASNCQPKHQLKPLQIEQLPMSTGQRKPKIQPTQPKKGLYYKNRTRLVQWMRSECAKFQLCHDTFANAVFLMDSYFKNSGFNSAEFLHIALCMMVIASKMNESKVLYTARMAKNSKVSTEKMIDREIQLLQWFKFKTNPYNFSKILTEYMKRWDISAKKTNLNFPLFLQETPTSFFLYQELFFICFCQLRFNRQLLVSTLKSIFAYFLQAKTNENEMAAKIVDEIFMEENIFARDENQHVFECLEIDSKDYYSYLAGLKHSVETWLEEFEEKREGLNQKYLQLKAKGMLHFHIMTIQF